LTVRRTFAVHRSRGFEQLATTVHPLPVSFLFLNAQVVSPAQAPSGPITAGNKPCRFSRGEQPLTFGAQTPVTDALGRDSIVDAEISGAWLVEFVVKLTPCAS
jgi:hypothetical protein